ncbi:unnamed protein product [Amoebophrya sp. A120]|nr:unnamed protein product [Amoebophrya sp. A120]|eukprot:GSA120T00002188001.1
MPNSVSSAHGGRATSSTAAVGEASVEFLCKKFTNLFSHLQQAEAEKADLQQERDQLRIDLDTLQSHKETSDNLTAASLANLRGDLESSKRERHALQAQNLAREREQCTLELELRAARERIQELQRRTEERRPDTRGGGRALEGPEDHAGAYACPEEVAENDREHVQGSQGAGSASSALHLLPKAAPGEAVFHPPVDPGLQGSCGAAAAAPSEEQNAVDALFQKLDRNDDLVQTLYQEMQTLRLQNASYKKQSERKDVELQLQDERWREEFQCFKLQKEELQKTCRALSTKNSRVNALLAETKELQQQQLAYKERLDAVRARNTKIEADAKHAEGTISALREQEGRIKEKLREEIRKCDVLASEKKELEAGRVKLLQDLSAKANEVESSGEELEGLSRRADELAEKNEELLARNDDLEKAESGYLETIDALRRENESLQLMADNLRGELRLAFQEKEAVKAEYQENVQKMDLWRNRCLVLEPELADTTRHNIRLEEKLKYLEQELLHESEQRAKFQREALLNVDKARGLSRKCEHLSDKISLAEHRNTSHFQKVLEQQQQLTPAGAVGGATGPSPVAGSGNKGGSKNPKTAASIDFLRRHVQKEEERILRSADSGSKTC